MATKTQLRVRSVVQLSAELVDRVLASCVIVDASTNELRPPTWARTRGSVLRGVLREINEHGRRHFMAEPPRWESELSEDGVLRRLTIARRIREQWLPELDG